MSETAVKKFQISERLPSPSAVALRVVELAGKEDASLDTIVMAIQADPALAVQILRLANAPLNGIARRVGSLRTAISLLGLKTVKSAALSFSLTANYRVGQCLGFDYEGFWSDSLARASAARHLADRLGTVQPDEAFTCGLLSQIGRLGLATVFPDQYAVICKEQNPAVLARLEHERFFVDHNEMGEQMIMGWSLPEANALAVRHQAQPDGEHLEVGSPVHLLAQLLQMSGWIARFLANGGDAGLFPARMTQSPRMAKFKESDLDTMVPAIGNEWVEAGSIFSIKTKIADQQGLARCEGPR